MIRYPVGLGTQADFEQHWYSALNFGDPQPYGFHDGADLNLRRGGDTDLGEYVYAIAPGRLVYWHYDRHPTVGFGRHLIYKIVLPGGLTRWVHCAHLGPDDFYSNTTLDFPEGTLLGRIGKSGLPAGAFAHLHFAIFKTDPGGNIDNVANSMQELNLIWEDPLAFIKTWMVPEPVITLDTRIPQIDNLTVAELKSEIDILNAIRKLAA